MTEFWRLRDNFNAHIPNPAIVEPKYEFTCVDSGSGPVWSSSCLKKDVGDDDEPD